MIKIVRRCESNLTSVQRVIAEIMDWAEPLLSLEEASYLKLILCELAANAAEHGGCGLLRDAIVLRVGIVPQLGVVVAVGDKAGQPIHLQGGGGLSLEERGRGLMIVEALTEHLVFRNSTNLMVARRRFGP